MGSIRLLMGCDELQVGSDAALYQTRYALRPAA